ncbi:MAG: NifU family protein [Synergistales bacterium]|nr:NifU family protein [Synergistales bacterium]
MVNDNRIRDIMDKYVRPALQSHGGDGEIVSFDQEKGEVKVRLTGSCGSCPFAQMTLRSLVLRVLQEHIPEVKSVVGE